MNTFKIVENNYSDIITELNSTLKFALGHNIKLIEKIPGLFIAESQICSRAINNKKNAKEEVIAINWFDDFWIYFQLKFINKNIFISLSLFQGSNDDQIKNQLFRAEWDNYENNDEHPQPHWHIYPIKYDNKTYQDFETYIEMVGEPSFEEIVEEKTKENVIIDISRFHFALNGNWYDDGTHKNLCVFEETKKIGKWLGGLLFHIKTLLEYLKDKI